MATDDFQRWFHNQRGSCGLSDASCKFHKVWSGGESERAAAAKCLFAFNSDKALPLSISLLLHLLPHRWIKAGQGASNHRVRCQAERVDVRAPLEKRRKKNREGIKVLEYMKTRTV